MNYESGLSLTRLWFAKMKTVMTMQKSIYHIPKMDCPSEEQLIRMALSEEKKVVFLEFDLPQRQLTVYHQDAAKAIEARLTPLALGATLQESSTTDFSPVDKGASQERQILWQVLAINLFFFIVELGVGFFADSMGLVSDGLDMLADTLVYGLALMAVGHSVQKKKRVARFAGWFQVILALLGILEVIRRVWGHDDLPDFQWMIGISLLALVGNASCLFILQKSRNQDAHMQASLLFTSNDVIVNLGVILSAGLVYWTQSPYPDLIMGILVFALVARGASQILSLSK